jgi:hypothetical protein
MPVTTPAATTAPIDVQNHHVEYTGVASSSAGAGWVRGADSASVRATCARATSSNGADTLIGRVDEVALWTRALSASEISEVYASGSEPPP